jgi:hypothetical protein
MNICAAPLFRLVFDQNTSIYFRLGSDVYLQMSQIVALFMAKVDDIPEMRGGHRDVDGVRCCPFPVACHVGQSGKIRVLIG